MMILHIFFHQNWWKFCWINEIFKNFVTKICDNLNDLLKFSKIYSPKLIYWMWKWEDVSVIAPAHLLNSDIWIWNEGRVPETLQALWRVGGGRWDCFFDSLDERRQVHHQAAAWVFTIFTFHFNYNAHKWLQSARVVMWQQIFILRLLFTITQHLIFATLA